MAPSSLRLSSGFKVLSVLLLALLAAPIAAQNGDGAESSAPDLKAKGLALVKVYCLVIIFFATFLPGVSPYYLRWNAAFLVLGIQFAAGVFLATAMLHFLGDSNSTFEQLTTKTYPFAFMLAVTGYLLTMLADFIIQHVYSRRVAANRSPFDVEADNFVTGGELQPEGGKKSNVLRQSGTDDTIHNIVKATLMRRASLGDAMLLIFALCFHSVFEGIAIGIASTQYDAWRNL
ncbi:unnamed protein product [Calypogeia fissa]